MPRSKKIGWRWRELYSREYRGLLWLICGCSVLLLQARGEVAHSRHGRKWQVDGLEAAGEPLIPSAAGMYLITEPRPTLRTDHHAPRRFRRCGASSLCRDHVSVSRRLPRCTGQPLKREYFTASPTPSNPCSSCSSPSPSSRFRSPRSMKAQRSSSRTLIQTSGSSVLSCLMHYCSWGAIRRFRLFSVSAEAGRENRRDDRFPFGLFTDCKARWQLNDSAPYFFSEVGRTLREDYIPTDQDIIRSRVRTTGVSPLSSVLIRVNSDLTSVASC